MADPHEIRENWGSRSGFILAAVGSAVGLGNIWRFPHECYSHGGSAFLIPYVIAMLVIGIPLLIMEFSLGHLTQQAAPNAFGRVGRKWEFVGWWPIVLSFVIVCYYAAVLAWCLNYCIFSFSANVDNHATREKPPPHCLATQILLPFGVAMKSCETVGTSVKMVIELFRIRISQHPLVVLAMDFPRKKAFLPLHTVFDSK